MASASDQDTGVAFAKQPLLPQVSTPLRTGDSGVEPVPPRTVYLEYAQRLLPRWLHLVGKAPWFDELGSRGGVATASPPAFQRRQSATLAIAVLAGVEEGRPDEAYLRECVRASLVRWQLSLRGDGRPARRRLAHSALPGSIALSVVQTMTESIGFQTPELLQDVERHLGWLAKRPPATPCFEAATVCVLAEGSLLCRDGALLNRARVRLDGLLARQSDEGWFPERGGADIGRLSQTVDALARLSRITGWGELSDSLRNALAFLTHFVHPDDSVGGCYSSCGTAFLGPYGVELLATEFSDAALLSRVARRRLQRLLRQRISYAHDDLHAVLGASIALAAANVGQRLDVRDAPPPAPVGTKHFPKAGLSIIRTRSYFCVVAGHKGGTLHVTWHGGAPALDDPGVTVAFHRRMRVSGRQVARCRYEAADRSCSSEGILAAIDAERRRWRRQVWGFLAWLSRPLGARVCQGFLRFLRIVDPKRLMHDRFRREVTFGEDWIRIFDRIQCRLPCQTIVCQSPVPGRPATLVDASSVGGARPPIYVTGGRRVTITRLYRAGELVDPRSQELPGGASGVGRSIAPAIRPPTSFPVD